MPPTIEDKIRRGLPFIRFMQTYMPLQVSRSLLKIGMARLRFDKNVQLGAVSAGGVPCQWILPQGSLPGRCLIYLHGGGFVLGLTPLHLRMGAYLAEKLCMRILMVDYRLAPEHPFPAALDDCAAAYTWLLQQGYLPQHVVMAGDSAGGNLTLTTLLKLRDEGLPLPAAAVCLSPVTDLTDKTGQHIQRMDPLLPPKAVRMYKKSYLGQSDPHNPLISPVFSFLGGLPPLLVHAGEDEILLEDALCLTSLAKEAGVDVRLEIYPCMWHVWQLNLALPQAQQSLDDITRFLSTHLDPVPQPLSVN